MSTPAKSSGKTPAEKAPAKSSASGERTAKGQARELILDAAEKVFGEAGIKGATTREIARVAGVNETTLFRNFPTKMALLLALIEKIETEADKLIISISWTYELPEDLRAYAHLYFQHHFHHRALILSFMGESVRIPTETQQVLTVVRKPFSSTLVDYFEAAKQKKIVRPDLNCLQTAHAFEGIIFSRVIGKNLLNRPYETGEYFDTVVDLFTRGIQPTR